jgi:hypothetical protein
LVVGDGDAELDQRLSDELDVHNVAASGVSDQREFAVRVQDDEGGLVAWSSRQPPGVPTPQAADVHFVKHLR